MSEPFIPKDPLLDRIAEERACAPRLSVLRELLTLSLESEHHARIGLARAEETLLLARARLTGSERRSEELRLEIRRHLSPEQPAGACRQEA